MTLRRFIALLCAALFATTTTSLQAFADGTVNGEEKRWSKVIPTVPAVTEQRWQLTKTTPAQTEKTLNQYKYWQVVPAVPKKSHEEFRFRKLVSSSHSEYRQRNREIRNRWAVGLKYAHDVYTREAVPIYQESVVYKYDRFVSQWSLFAGSLQWLKVGETEWGERQVTESLNTPPNRLFQEMFANEQTKIQRIETGSKWKYSKLARKGDRHPSLYGPYEVFADPKKVSFVVGFDQRLVGKEFDLGEHMYDARGKDSVIKYVYRQVAGPFAAGYTEWSDWSDWTETRPGSESTVKQIQARNVQNPDAWAYLNSGEQETSSKSDAAWHRMSGEIEEAGWEAFDTKVVVDQEAITESTVYLLADGTTIAEAEMAEWINKPPEKMSEWSPLLDDQGQPVVNPIVLRPAMSERTVYMNSIGTETEDETRAGWYTLATGADESGWTRVNEESHEISPEIPEHIVYYVPDGEPTLTLGESNWTADVPEGWTLVDSRSSTNQGEMSATYPAYNLEVIFWIVLVVAAGLLAGIVTWRKVTSWQGNRPVPHIDPNIETVEGPVLDPIRPSTYPRATYEDASEDRTIRFYQDGSMRQD